MENYIFSAENFFIYCHGGPKYKIEYSESVCIVHNSKYRNPNLDWNELEK